MVDLEGSSSKHPLRRQDGSLTTSQTRRATTLIIMLALLLAASLSRCYEKDVTAAGAPFVIGRQAFNAAEGNKVD